MTPPFPAVHSVLAPEALANLVRHEYDLSPDIRVSFLRRGINDTYLVQTPPDSLDAVLRVYQTRWRTADDLAWEVALIERAAVGGVGVARPLLRRDGTHSGVLEALEGPRPYVLFEHAPGRNLEPVAEDGARYGQTAAALHIAADGLEAAGRFPLDLHHLTTAPLEALRPLVGDPNILRELEEVAARTHAALAALAPRLEWGACHGDLHEGNAHLGADGILRLFDFDCGGPGYRAYDLSVYLWSQAFSGRRTREQEDAAWTAFLTAYRDVRPLAEVDVQAIPLFVVARSLWLMGLYAQIAPVEGIQMLSAGFLQHGLTFITKWEARET